MTTSDDDQSEPRFMLLRDDSPAMVDARNKAKESLGAFRRAWFDKRFDSTAYEVKAYFPEADGSVGPHLWVWLQKVEGVFYECSTLDVPSGFTGFGSYEKIVLKEDQIEDWRILDGDVLNGGFSLRVQRTLVPEDERSKWDQYAGINRYADELP